MTESRTQTVPLFGDVYLMQFDGEGSEQSGVRPGIVFQNNIGNFYSPNIIAIPITSSIKKTFQPTHVLLRSSDTGLARDSIALCENPQRMSKNRLGKYLGHLSDSYIREIVVANLLATCSISYIDLETLVKVWEKSIRMNSKNQFPFKTA